MAFRIVSELLMVVAAAVYLGGCTCSNDLVTPREVEPTTRATLRIVHASPDAGSLTCQQNDKYFMGSLTYGGVTPAAASLPSELRNLRMFVSDGTVVLSVNVGLRAERQHTFIVLDSVERMRGLLVTDEAPTPQAGMTQLRVINADVAGRMITVIDPSNEESVGFAQAGVWHAYPAGGSVAIRRENGTQVTIPAGTLVSGKAYDVVVRDPDGPGASLLVLDVP